MATSRPGRMGGGDKQRGLEEAKTGARGNQLEALEAPNGGEDWH